MKVLVDVINDDRNKIVRFFFEDGTISELTFEQVSEMVNMYSI